MRILYGIAGDGIGHAVRSAVIIEELLRRGHEVRIVVSGSAKDYIEEKFPDVTEIWGLSVVTRGNKISEALTIAANVREGLAPSGLPRNIYQQFKVARQFDPDVVITDCELWSWFFGALRDVPVIGLDNVHQLTRCSHPADVIGDIDERYPLARFVVQARVPSAEHYLVSTFAPSEPEKENTTLVPPILRDAILEATPSDGEHLLVYQTSYSKYDLVPVLRELDYPVRVYGLEEGIDRPKQIENVELRPFSESGFIEDLASCRAVVGSAGFTLMTEALHHGKPYFAIPVEGQIEQMLNARYLDWLGYGSYASEPKAPTIQRFLDRLPEFRSNLESYERHDNEPTFDALQTMLDRYAHEPGYENRKSQPARSAP